MKFGMQPLTLEKNIPLIPISRVVPEGKLQIDYELSRGQTAMKFGMHVNLCFGKGHVLPIPISQIVAVVGLKIVNERSFRPNSEVHADEVAGGK
ncbi:jg12166 [Pararge aegeria aegeria]|uniref:Jg12166 protein n=1 Tax=Pararge aegeria aegeria TaxID=348720 RepID=A0A8S4RQ74_9NEOP|nr:jg12166 [Pararge aegeria aegeria]